ncbi:HAD family hydrolase [Halarsenatibacter silvermanii]|uniref:Cof subfamily of IIB subfamily of haloacid dehalogenase superfamily/HAD-superfamily hydrolase, subfamily IIB n=1 Tax=Halarsenatibacter silvermanii TaxID=321763 RepID=A0A1G9RQE4_9FIRM|nr:HAD family hydrolase [Halarsenatibacter silvermanii]SDM25569.1 hypothetical protein SAMN04488692_12329 [Halarsenatibacter silvermanii]
MEFKLVVLDLDDTLLRDDQTIEPRAARTIKKFKDEGIEFMIATGRAYCTALPFQRELKIDSPIICHNGAFILDGDGRELYHKPVALPLAREIMNFCHEHGLELCIYNKDSLYFRRRNEQTAGYERTSGIVGEPVHRPLAEVMDSPPTKMLILEEDRRRQEHYIARLRDLYSCRLNITTSKSHFIEVINSSVDKSEALKYLGNHMDFEPEEVVAMGNGFNDLGMIDWAGMGIAVENAPAGIKNSADKITASNEEAGVARALQSLFGSSDEEQEA